MALSHLDTSEGFTENGAGSAVLISDRVAVVVLVGWVDMGLTGGLFTGGTMVAGFTAEGMYGGSEVFKVWGVVARSRGLLELGSGLMLSGFRLILGLR